MVKKTYNQPTCLVVELSSRDAMLQSISNTADGMSFGGGTGTNDVTSADTKGVSNVNVWDEEW